MVSIPVSISRWCAAHDEVSTIGLYGTTGTESGDIPKIWKISEKIRKNTEKYGKIRKSTEKYGKSNIDEYLENEGYSFSGFWSMHRDAHDPEHAPTGDV